MGIKKSVIRDHCLASLGKVMYIVYPDTDMSAYLWIFFVGLFLFGPEVLKKFHDIFPAHKC